jgi:DNA mismatch endonuclease (patch repair protein)
VNRDHLTKVRRSWNMSRIRGKDTTPERVVRSLLHRLGYHFHLNVCIPIPLVGTARCAVRTPQRGVPTLVVRPDIVLPKHRVAIFVHGCFWHRHRGCKNCTTPTHRRAWWLKKLNGNAARDKMHQRALRKLGWHPIVVWECQTEKPKTLDRLSRRLSNLVG